MAIDVATLKEKLASAYAAIESEEWGAARRYLLSAKAILAGIPDSYQNGTGFQYRQEINGLLDEVKAAQKESATSSAGGIQVQKVEYTEATD